MSSRKSHLFLNSSKNSPNLPAAISLATLNQDRQKFVTREKKKTKIVKKSCLRESSTETVIQKSVITYKLKQLIDYRSGPKTDSTLTAPLLRRRGEDSRLLAFTSRPLPSLRGCLPTTCLREGDKTTYLPGFAGDDSGGPLRVCLRRIFQLKERALSAVKTLHLQKTMKYCNLKNVTC